MSLANIKRYWVARRESHFLCFCFFAVVVFFNGSIKPILAVLTTFPEEEVTEIRGDFCLSEETEGIISPFLSILFSGSAVQAAKIRGGPSSDLTHDCCLAPSASRHDLQHPAIPLTHCFINSSTYTCRNTYADVEFRSSKTSKNRFYARMPHRSVLFFFL